jgi:hypothetical protein
VGRWTGFRHGPLGGLARGAASEEERAIFGFGPLRGLARGESSARAGRGPFSIFGPNFTVNSNISQFIFYSEII